MGKKLMVLTLCALAASLLVGTVAQAADPDLMAWWKLDDGTGTVALDSSGYENHGTLMNAAWSDDPERGMVISFDGTSGYVSTDVILPAMTMENGFTWVFWVKQPAAQAVNNDTILGNRYGGTASPLQFCKFTPTRFEFYNDDGAYANGINYDPFPSDVWVHNALVKDGAELTYYRDGVVALTNTMVKTVDENPFYMGADGFSGAQEGWEGYLSDVRLYTRALSEAEVLAAMAGKGPISKEAIDPAPETEAIDIPRDVVVSWTPGEYAATHDVYFGTALDDVTSADRTNPMGVLLSQGQADASFDPEGVLELGQTYYWRVDEVNAAPDNSIFTGEVWSFTVEPVAYPIEGIVATCNVASEEGVGPENTVDGSGLNADGQHSTDSGDMWLVTPTGADPVQLTYEFDQVYKLQEMRVWNYNVIFELILGFGLKDVTVEYSVDGVEWTLLGDVEFARATAMADYTANTTVAFDGVAVRYVRLTANSGYGTMGQLGLSEVQFMYIPAHAREPQPGDGAAGVSVDTMLGWRAGREAVTHDVYLGTDPEGLALVDSVSEPTYVPDNLEFGSTYYWKIIEVNEADAIAAWEGNLWSFSTQEYALIDDMEAYNDEDNVIYEAWIDGWVNETGSTVGYLESPFAEQTIVNSGRQSMPLAYDNSLAPFYSEAEHDLGGMNLAANGADTLRLSVSGQAPAFVENADGTILMNAIGADIWGTADECRYVYKSLTGDGSMIARVDYLDGDPSTWAKGGVMVRQSAEAGAINTYMAMTGGDGGGATFQQRLEADTDSVSQHTYDGNPFAPPYWVKLERTGNAFSAYISPDGETWQQAADTVSVPMTDPVLIGLALTSHNASLGTSALFSNVSFTGNVTGAWQIAEIGVAQPATGNEADTLYVALEDTAGHVAVVENPDAYATVKSGWTEWLIPYSELGGVNLNSVRTMFIGVGDRDNPTSGGAGLIFIDDIGYGHSAADQ